LMTRLENGPIEPMGKLLGARGADPPVVIFDPMNGRAALDRISLYEDVRVILHIACLL